MREKSPALRRHDTQSDSMREASSTVHSMPDAPPSPQANPIPVLVLGEGITPLGVVRAFARQGIPVYGACGDGDLLRRSRFYRDLPGFSRGTRCGLEAEPAAIARAIARSGLPRVVLCACSDQFSAAVAALPEAAAQYLRSMPSGKTLRLLNDKGELAQLLQRLKIDHPATRLVRRVQDLDEPFQAPGEQLFLKPRDSQRFFDCYKRKAFRVASPADARAKLEEFQRLGFETVLQAYVPGPSSNHYFVDGFRDRTGVVRVHFARRRLRIYPPDFGNSTAMVSVSADQLRGAVDSLDRLLDATDYRGIFSAEFKLDARDNRFRLLEVNTRPWWFIDFAVRAGADVCAMMYHDALDLPVASAPTYRIGARCVYPRHDIAAVAGLRKRGESYGWLQWGLELFGAMQPVWAWDDPIPAVYEAASELAHRATR